MAQRRRRKETRFERRMRERREATRKRQHEIDHEYPAGCGPVVVGLLVLVAAVAGLTAWAWWQPARGAVRVPFTWTAPDRVERYEALARRSDGTISGLNLWGDSTGAAAPTLVAPGAPQAAWALISEDWRAGGWMVWVRGCNSAGCAGWSNAAVVTAGMPDTLWHLERDGQPLTSAPRDGVVWKRAKGRVGWSLSIGDSVSPARIVHQEDVQRASIDAICRSFTFWALRGGPQPCP